MMREGLVRLLTDRGFEVCAAVADADALRDRIAATAPDVAVIDIRMPPTHTDEGLRAAIDIRRDHPGVGVLVFSQYVETRYATGCSPTGRPGSAICSRTALPTSPTSWTRWSGWRPAAPHWTPRWSAA